MNILFVEHHVHKNLGPPKVGGEGKGATTEAIDGCCLPNFWFQLAYCIEMEF